MAKEKLKTSDPYKYYRNAYVGLEVGKWGSIIAPFIAIFIAKYGEYFQTAEGTKLSLGCVLALAVGGVAIWQETKKTSDGEYKGTPVSHALGWGVAWALSYLFASILNDLTLILGCAFIGQLIGLGFDIEAKDVAEKKKVCKNAEIQTLAKRSVTKKVKEKEDTNAYE